MTYTSEHLAFLASIRDDPDNNTARLAYADYLDEKELDPIRAELIRVQVELERYLTTGQTPPKRLEKREDELLAPHADRWRKGPMCVECGGSGFANEAPDHPSDRRRCHSCWGTGDAGGLYRHDKKPPNVYDKWWYKVTYHRGMKRMECRAEDVWRWKADHDNNEGAWLPTPWAVAVCTYHPDVVEFMLSDRKPETTGGTSCRWLFSDSFSGRQTLPTFLEERMTGRTRIGMWYYHTKEDASLHLGRELVKWVHSFNE